MFGSFDKFGTIFLMIAAEEILQRSEHFGKDRNYLTGRLGKAASRAVIESELSHGGCFLAVRAGDGF